MEKLKRGRKRIETTAEQDSQIIELHSKGLLKTEICKEMNLSYMIIGRAFDKLNLSFKFGEIKTDGTLVASGYKTHDSKDEYEGITEDYIVTDVVENTDGTLRYIRKRIIVKNGLIVGQQVMNQ